MYTVKGALPFMGIKRLLFPQDDTARKITLLTLLPVALAYMGRILINQWLEYDRASWNFGMASLIICPILCFIVSGLVVFILGLAFISARRAHHLAPAFVLLAGLALVPFLPLPPLPLPVYPEQEFFSAHRAEFEQVVNLARQDKLKCMSGSGCSVIARKLPFDLNSISVDGIVQVARDAQSGLTLKFLPINLYYPIVYFDAPDDKRSPWYSECQEDRWTRKLDEHWYLCIEDD